MPSPNTHRAFIETSVPPSMTFIASGSQGFCTEALGRWVEEHGPLGKYDTGVVAKVVMFYSEDEER